MLNARHQGKCDMVLKNKTYHVDPSSIRVILAGHLLGFMPDGKPCSDGPPGFKFRVTYILPQNPQCTAPLLVATLLIQRLRPLGSSTHTVQF